MRLQKILCSLTLSFFGALSIGSSIASGQSLVRDRVTQQVTSSSTIALPGSVSPLAKAKYDLGRANASTPISGVTMYFQPSATQQAALNALVQAQQTPGSSWYHKWITPAQYAAQFGLSANDLAKVEAWLEQQGFSIDRVSNSRNAISFSGTVAQLESAFQTEIHHYSINGVTHTANSTAISIPAALSGVVLSVSNVSDFRPHPLHRANTALQLKSNYNFSSGGTTYHFLAPGDFATIYDVNALYNAGYPVAAAQLVEHGAADALGGEGLELHALLAVEARHARRSARSCRPGSDRRSRRWPAAWQSSGARGGARGDCIA